MIYKAIYHIRHRALRAGLSVLGPVGCGVWFSLKIGN